MMKKSIIFILVAMMLVSLASCGKDGDTENKGSDTNSVASTVSADTPSADDTTVSNEPVDGEFFDDAVFIGDSVSLKLNYYVDKIRDNIGLECLGDATFLCSGSLSFGNSLWDIDAENNVHPSYQGTQYLLPDGVQATGKSKVFIMLGMNDFSLYGIDDTITNAKTMIDAIIEKNPNATIYLQSVTPILKTAQYGDFTNANVEELNKRYKALCEENGWNFLDVASVLKDEEGCLPANYCSDPDAQGIHFTDEACEIWINYLESNV